MAKGLPPESARRGPAVRKACAVLLDSGADFLPPDPDRVGRALGVLEVLSFSAAAKRLGRDSWEFRKQLLGQGSREDGAEPSGEGSGLFRKKLPGEEAFSFLVGPDRYLILYDDYVRSPERIRFSLFHEFGHIALGHLEDFDLEFLTDAHHRVLEAEANIFARNILCPPPIVDLLRGGPEDARGADLFCVSPEAWRVRLETLEGDRACISQRTADLIRIRFRNYLAGRRCRDCGAVFLDESRSGRCPRCGSRFLRWNPAMESLSDDRPGRHMAGAEAEDLRPRIGEDRAADLAAYWELLRKKLR